LKESDKQVIWAEFPSLAPPWQLPAEMLDAYFDAESDSGTTDNEPWADPPTRLPPGDENLDPLQSTYAAVATFADAQIGRLLDKLRQEKLLDSLLLVLTSSRTLPLGEHGWIGNQRAWQHEENVHLPLLVRLPNADKAGLRIGALTQPVDVAPTVTEYLGLPPPPLPGRSLLPLIRQEIAELRPHAFSGERIGDSVELSLRTLEWAYLLPMAKPADDPPRFPQLYVKPDDRWEVNDVSQHHPELVEQLDKKLREFVAANPSVPC
jgi:arylsulfatase A-like enzyme